MKIEIINKNNISVAQITAEECIINDVQSAIDLMITVKYEKGIKNFVLSKSLVTDKFFILSSGIAGEILQKFINYQFRLAIYGDYSQYTSKPLKDFIYESNNGKNVFFTANLDDAIDKLTNINN